MGCEAWGLITLHDSDLVPSAAPRRCELMEYFLVKHLISTSKQWPCKSILMAFVKLLTLQQKLSPSKMIHLICEHPSALDANK